MIRKLVAVLGFLIVVQAYLAVPAGGAEKQNIALPAPKAALGIDLMQALKQRMSIRSYAPEPVPLEIIATVLWAGYGVNRPDGKHTVPTARGADVLDLYVVFDTGTYRYDPSKHALTFISANAAKGTLARGGAAAKAAFVVVLVGKPDELPGGASREDRTAFVHCTAGAAAENMYLAAGACGLGTVIMGAIRKDDIVKALDLSGGRVPLYVMPFGYRR